MPGAGSASVAWAPETSYLGGTASTPTYREPGTNVQVQTAELNRNLLAILAPGDVETQEWLAQQLGGQLAVSFVLKNDEFHRLVFNDGNTGFTSGLANSAEWYLGTDYIGGTTERQIKGWVPASATIQYSGSTEAVRVTMTGPYGDEVKNTSITPGSVSNAGDEVPGHGASLSVDGSPLDDRLQSATISFEGISRLQRGASQKPIEAVTGNVTESVSLESIYDGPEQYERVLGSSGASSIETDVAEVPGSVDFSAGGTTIASYDFSSVAPTTYGWNDLVNNDADLTESVEYNATGVTASDPTV